MAKSVPSLPVLFLLLVLFLSNAGGGMVKVAKGQRTWCVPKPSTSDDQLTKNKIFCCDNGADCTLIEPGGPCFEPNTLINQASVVMNSYYQKNGRQIHTCFFNNSGLITFADPSYDGCYY